MIKCILSEGATIPARGTEQSAGLDLHAAHDFELWPESALPVNTGVKIEIPTGYYGSIEGRSSLFKYHSIMAFHGIIDADYQGEIIVMLYNLGGRCFVGKKGQRVAQLLLPAVNMEILTPVKDFETVTLRGNGGFGSTGE